MKRTLTSQAREGFHLWDAYLLRNQPYIWSRGAFVWPLAILVWFCCVVVTSFVYPMWSSDVYPSFLFLLVVQLVAAFATVIISVAAVVVAERAGFSAGMTYAWPEEENLDVSWLQKMCILAPVAIALTILVVGPRFPFEVMMWRHARMMEDQELVDDLNAINQGLAACAQRFPHSEAAVNRRPIPMSTSEITYLRTLDARFVDPRVLLRAPPTNFDANAVDQQIVALERALRKYAEFKAVDDMPSGGQFRKQLNDLDEPIAPDPRSETETICLKISLKDLRTLDINVARILEAKRYQAEPFVLLIRLCGYGLLAVIWASTMLHLGMIGGLAWGIASYITGFGISAFLEYSQYSAPGFVVCLPALILSIWGWCWIRGATSPWPNETAYPSMSAAFPGMLALNHVWSGPAFFGITADWFLILVALVPFWMLWEKLSAEIQIQVAEPIP